MEGILFPKGIVEGREGLKEHRARGGYEALAKALGTNDAELVASIMLYQFNHKLSEAEL